MRLRTWYPRGANGSGTERRACKLNNKHEAKLADLDNIYAIVQWYEMELLIGHTHILFYFIVGRNFRIFYFSARAVLGLCLFEHFDPASDTTRATPANH